MPGPDPTRSLEERVARLERLVERLAAAQSVASAGPPPAEPASSAGLPPPEPPPRPGAPRRPIPDFAWARAGEGATAQDVHQGRKDRSESTTAATSDETVLGQHGERWLGRVGVAFVVLAFGFLFRYAFDQGWIGPALRLLLGAAAATAMLGVGLRLERLRERYSHYLLGGAIALYYLVGFASYQLYELVPFAFAFALMAATTVLAFALAERQRLGSLAVIGAAGGLATPLLLSTGSTDVLGLVAYTTLLLAGAGAVQFWRGWRMLLVVLGLGGLAVMAVAVAAAADTADVLEQTAVLVGIVAAWALFGAVPLLRAHLHRVDPGTWPEPGLADEGLAGGARSLAAVGLLRFGCLAASLVAVPEIGALLSVERAAFGLLFALGSVVYVALAARFAATRGAFEAAAETASVLLVLAVTLFFWDDRAYLPLAVAGSGMHLAHQRWTLVGVAAIAHALFALLLVFHLSGAAAIGLVPGGSPFGVIELGILGAIVMAAVASVALPEERIRTIYRVAVHVALLVWLARQFAPMELGQELTSLSWGVYGIALLLVALRIDHRGLKLAGLGTLGLVALKLLVVDMAQVDVIWRILLFMGFGAAFLGLSYLINRSAR